jgi:hypothetical protein
MSFFKDGVLIERSTTTASSGTTVTLTVLSTVFQRFTGTAAQTVKLPDATTLTVGQKYVLQNRSTAPMSVQDGSAAALFTIPSGQDRTFQIYTIATVAGTWDINSSGSGGGGGGSLQWTETQTAPTPLIDSASNRVYSFQQGLSQSLSAVIKVPKSYSVGDQINLLLPFYTPDTTGTALMLTIAVLNRPGTDAYTSGANVHTSSNTAITLSGGTANIPQMVSFDLTDASGTINGVAVAPSNLLFVFLQRAGDTGVSDLAALVYGAEVTF